MPHTHLMCHTDARETTVVRLALENAVSAAGVLLLTEATMTDIPEPKPGAAAAEGLS